MTLAWVALGSLVVAAAVVRERLLQRRLARMRTRLEDALEQLQRLERAFSRFAPSQVVEQVIASDELAVGESREVTVLFADLVGFTALSEAVEPGVLVRILNGYFERMSRAITEHRGHVSTFIGDGILALFGAHDPNPWQSDDAAHAALAMREELADYNRELASEGLPPLGLGVGLHRGLGVAGVVGSPDLMQFAFIGRTVNLAARVQDLTRSFGVDILLTPEVRSAIDPRFRLRELPASELRGIAEPVVTFAAEGFDPDDRHTGGAA